MASFWKIGRKSIVTQLLLTVMVTAVVASVGSYLYTALLSDHHFRSRLRRERQVTGRIVVDAMRESVAVEDDGAVRTLARQLLSEEAFFTYLGVMDERGKVLYETRGGVMADLPGEEPLADRLAARARKTLSVPGVCPEVFPILSKTRDGGSGPAVGYAVLAVMCRDAGQMQHLGSMQGLMKALKKSVGLYLTDLKFFQVRMLMEDVLQGHPDVVYLYIMTEDGTVVVSANRSEEGKVKEAPRDREALAVSADRPFQWQTFRDESWGNVTDMSAHLPLEDGAWVVLRMGISDRTLLRERHQAARLNLALLTLLGVAATALAVVVARRQSAPIVHLIRSVQAVRAGDYQQRVTFKKGPAELRALVAAFNDMVAGLRELELGAGFQKELVPTEVRRLDDFEMASALVAQRRLSGDLINVQPMSGNRVQFVNADVSGKGLRSGMYSLLLLSLLRVHGKGTVHPIQVCERINEDLLAIAETTGLYCTLGLGLLSTRTGAMAYVSCGHPPPLYYSAEKQAWSFLNVTGSVLGLEENISLGTLELAMAPGDFFVSYSDGLTDAQDAQGNFFDMEKVLAALKGFHPAAAQTVVDTLLEKMNAFHHGQILADDVCILAIGRTAQPPPA